MNAYRSFFIALVSVLFVFGCGGDDDEAASTVEPIATGAGDTSTSAEPAEACVE